MPVYDYKCEKHGSFYELATIDDSHKPQACPQCNTLSARIIRLNPEVLTMAPERKAAFEKNEKAQNEPVISTADRRKYDEQHSKGCGCHNPKNKSKMLYTARGEKVFPSMRPWMISH